MKFKMVFFGQTGKPPAELSEPCPPVPPDMTGMRYAIIDGQIVRLQYLPGGRIRQTAVANFHGRLVRDKICLGSDDPERNFDLKVELDGRRIDLSLSAAEFARMDWPLHRFGPRVLCASGLAPAGCGVVLCARWRSVEQPRGIGRSRAGIGRPVAALQASATGSG
jgi:hypothetical protein